MKTLILKPQFIDRAGRTVFHVHEDDPDCRVLKAGHMLGQVRFGPNGFEQYEQIEERLLDDVITELDRGVKSDGTG